MERIIVNTKANGGFGALDPRAFVAVRFGEESWVVDLPAHERVVVGREDAAGVRIDATPLAPRHATLLWDGSRLTLRDEGSDAGTFLNGKRLEGSAELKPGDEIALGPAQLVVGVAMPPAAGGRRALTHHEFRERLWEEMARASRGGRPTALIMVQARSGEGGRIAATALDSFRAGDVVGTYAHDELEFLLPDTPAETARAVLERILAHSGAQNAIAGLAVAPTDGDNPERLLRAARSALLKAVAEKKGLETPPPKPPSFAEPEVHDPATKELLAELDRVAKTPGPVLLTGELSSGKGVFARVLHAKSDRANGPFVVVSCSAASVDPAGLGAGETSITMKAKGGTLVLDEIADLSLDKQSLLVDLLRAAGESLRIVATTHRALGGLVERGAFSSDLYQLLDGTMVDIPPLRMRPEDILPMAVRFAEENGAHSPVPMSPGALARLRSYPWPGNVLELRNAMERAVRLANGGEILAEHLPAETLPVGGEGRLREHVDSVERDAIVKALADSNHNQTHAAKRLGISRRALIYKMEKYGLKPPPGTIRRG